MRTSKTRWSTCFVAMIVIGCVGARAEAQDTVSITTPEGNPTWIAGNGATVAAMVYGSTPVSTMRVTIYATDDPTTILYSNTSTYVFFWYLNFTCPSGGVPGNYLACTLEVDAIGSDGVTIVGTSTTSVNIYTTN